MSIFRYFLFFLAQKRTSNYNLVDDCKLLFTQEGYKVNATWHGKKNKFITSWYGPLCTHTWVFFGVAYRHKLKHSLLGALRKMVLLIFENIKRDEWYWWKLL